MLGIQLKRKGIAILASCTLASLLWPVSSVAQAQNQSSGVSLSQLKGSSENEDLNPDSRPLVDGIAAVVNDEVITLRQLQKQASQAQMQLQSQGIPVPDPDTLKKQVLQRMISQHLELQEAKNQGIEVHDEDLQEAVKTIAERNNVSPEVMRRHIESSGMKWDDYLDELRQEVLIDMLRQRMVEHTIFISDAEVDAFLKNEGRNMALASRQPEPKPEPRPVQPVKLTVQPSGQIIGFRHILVAVPESASSSTVNELEQKAQGLLQKVSSGEDFAGVAAASSDAPEALEGGDMGVRPTEGWPDLFIENAKGLSEGQVTKVFKSGNGFHILQVAVLDGPQPAPQPAAQPQPQPQPDGLQGETGMFESEPVMPQGPVVVDQTHARHILIKTSKVVSDEDARQRLTQLKQRLDHGEDFAELAKTHSEDSTAPLGGDLGWLSPGETVPAFEQAMERLQPGQVSEPIQSQFGWHLIEVLDRRSKDMEDEYKRMQARQILFQRRVEPALEDWLNQLRGDAYIDNRIDPSANRSRNRR